MARMRAWARWVGAWIRWAAAAWWAAAAEGFGLVPPEPVAYSARCRVEPAPGRRCGRPLGHDGEHRSAAELAGLYLAPFEQLMLAPVPVPTTQPRHRASASAARRHRPSSDRRPTAAS